MIIEELFCGNLFPMNDVVPTQKAYRTESMAISKLLTELSEGLPKEIYAKIEELHNLMTTVQEYESEAQFKFGLSTGLLLMSEASAYIRIQQEK